MYYAYSIHDGGGTTLSLQVLFTVLDIEIKTHFNS